MHGPGALVALGRRRHRTTWDPCMTDNWKAHQRIDTRMSELAQEICDLSLSMDEANELFVWATQELHRNVVLSIQSLKFRTRVETHRQEIAERQVSQSNETLVTQLSELGIDPGPVFADRALGGD